MKKRLKALLKGLLCIVIVLVLAIGFIGQASFDFTRDVFTQNDYSNIMRDNIQNNPRVVDVAMLGAHDAFSNNISRRSDVDPQEDAGSILNNGPVRALAGGMFVRVARAQKSAAYELCVHGVRYFDVRVTRHNDDWYTMHGLISDRLEDYLLDIVRFLDKTDGEFIVFDIQHAHVGDSSMDALFAYIDSVRYNDKSLFDFVAYDPINIPLAQLRYDDVVQGGSGAVVLAVAKQQARYGYYEYDTSMRSVWHNKNSEREMLDGIDAEYRALVENPALDRDKFRVNQVQMTGKYSADSIARTIFGWSLLDMANGFNAQLLEQPDFTNWFGVLPILMTDYADSMKGDFNDRVIAAINDFNRALV